MVGRYDPVRIWFWNFVGFGLMWFLIGSGWSVARAKVYQLEVAEYKLQVGLALSEVRKASDTLQSVSATSPIAPKEKRKIRAATQKSDRILDAVEKDIEEETEKLINKEIEE